MQPENQRVLKLLGLAHKSRNMVSGSFMTEKTIKNGLAKMVIMSNDASDNTKKLFRDKCEFYQVPLFLYSDSEELGHALGKEARVSLAVTDTGFAEALGKLLKENCEYDGKRVSE
jgi:ribosomal protein L7Ae-like RNA K-turn-binding protein